jgi:hypothetical protein
MNLASSILVIFIHTPKWVWLLLAAVLVFGYLATRSRTLPVWRFLVLPLAMFAWSTYGVLSGPLSPETILVWLAAIGVGAVFGRHLALSSGASAGARPGTVFLPGEWWSFRLVLTIFVARYFFASAAAITPMLVVDPTFILAKVIVMGALGGTFAGRTAMIAAAARRRPTVITEAIA